MDRTEIEEYTQLERYIDAMFQEWDLLLTHEEIKKHADNIGKLLND